jgi:hypothetical protein
MKNEFFKLSFKEQKMLWIDKFSQIQSKNISKEHNQLLQSLKSELEKSTKVNDLYNENMEFITLKLMKITPKSDFIEMFMTLDNYKGNFSSNNFELCNWCINELETDFPAKRKIIGNYYSKIGQNQDVSKLSQVEGSCNCSWTCLEDATSNCTISGGCGFLFLFDCKKRS